MAAVGLTLVSVQMTHRSWALGHGKGTGPQNPSVKTIWECACGLQLSQSENMLFIAYKWNLASWQM